MSLKERVLRGTAILAVGQIATQVLRFAGNILLARILPQEAFGMNWILSAVSTGLWLLSDVGIAASVIRSHREDDAFLNTAWTLATVRGAALFALGALAGIPTALFYHESAFYWLMPMTALMVLILSMESTSIYTASRHLMFGRVVAIDVASQVMSLVVSVPVAYFTHSVVALALAGLTSAVVKSGLSHLVLPGARNRFAWDKSAIREIFSFGQWIFVSTCLAYVAGRWDVFSIGRLEGLALLGVYGLASQIASMPTTIGMQLTTSVLSPILSDAWRRDPAALTEALRRARRVYVPFGALLFFGAATTAPAFFKLLYKQEFADAGWMTQLLLVGAWFGYLPEASSRALLAAGDSRATAIGNALRVVSTIVGTLVGFEWFGFFGFVAGNTLGSLVGLLITSWQLQQRGVPLLRDEVVSTTIVLTVGALACGVPMLLARFTGIDVAWWSLASCVLVCGPLGLWLLRNVRRPASDLPAQA